MEVSIINKERKSQTELILEHMQEVGPISQLDALKEYGIMRLASRINDLKKLGYDIADEWKSYVNRLGETKRYKIYCLA